ncbi:MAG TPA: substrate-binding protein [Acetobacteraceae bacterium]|nr:substrate-binding protein [Acetobacteraceae bacterium]
MSIVTPSGLSRRGVLGLGAGLAAGTALGGLPRLAFAEDQPIGTWPAGVSGSTAFIGISVPRTGTYAEAGEDELKGYMLAIEHINEGNDLIRQMAPKVTKGLLGKQIIYGVADSQANPNVAVQNLSKFVSDNKAILLTGSCSSAEAVADNKFGQREHVIYLCGVSGSNDTTGKDCVRYGFRTCFYGQTSSAALSPVLIKEFGKNKKIAFLTPDYTYGHTVRASMQEYLSKEGGWTVATNQVCPLGAPDYSSYLLNIANSGADIFININWGNDAVQSIKQANGFGILQKMKLVVAYSVPFLAKNVGPELTQGVYTATDFWWTIEDKFPLAKMFVETFSKKYGYNPEWSAEAAYMQLACWARMVSEAGTFNPVEVIKTYEKGEHFNSLVGDVWFRPQDHQLVRPVIIQRGKAPSQMKSKDDYWEVTEILPGEPLMQPVGAFGCNLGPYV